MSVLVHVLLIMRILIALVRVAYITLTKNAENMRNSGLSIHYDYLFSIKTFLRPLNERYFNSKLLFS